MILGDYRQKAKEVVAMTLVDIWLTAAFFVKSGKVLRESPARKADGNPEWCSRRKRNCMA
jgi:hypothetical protein